MNDNGPSCRYVVNVIQRIRTADGSEKIASHGSIIGYDGASIRRSMTCDKPKYMSQQGSHMIKTTTEKLKGLTCFVLVQQDKKPCIC